MKISKLTQEIVNDIFLILRKVHDSHWKASQLNDVLDHLEADGVYEFKAGTVEKHMWTCRLTLTKLSGDQLRFEYHINNDLPKTMRTRQEKMKAEFDQKFTEYLMVRNLD